MKKFAVKNHLAILFFLSLVVWVLAFSEFFWGPLTFSSDAMSYYDNTKFYADNMIKGVFPLWNSVWHSGFPNDFFYRRLGVYNPFLWVILIFRKIGFSHMAAYSIFLVVYYFIGMLGFYSLVKRLTNNRLVSFAAYLLLMFSSLGTRMFDSYMHLVCVPLIWFFYFFVSFTKKQRRHDFLGMALTLMILASTYIPFYAITVIAFFMILYAVFYPLRLVDYARKYLLFFKREKLLTAFCILSLIVVLIPTVVFYYGVKKGEVVLPQRNYDWAHTPAPLTSQLEVDEETAITWGIMEDIMFSMSFDDLRMFKLAILYLPIFVYVILLLGLVTRFDKRQCFLWAWGLVILLMGMPFRVPWYQFLRDHVFYVKFFRNLHFFLWFILLPLFIVLAAEQLKKFLDFTPRPKKQRAGLLIFISLVHLGLAYFLFEKGRPLIITYVTIGLSCLFFLSYIGGWLKKRPALALLCVFAVIVPQPLEVYSYLPKNIVDRPFKIYASTLFTYHKPYEDFRYVRDREFTAMLREEDFRNKAWGERIPGIYVSGKWFNHLYQNVHPFLLRDYLRTPFIVFDQVAWVENEEWDFEKIQDAFYYHSNVVFVKRPLIVSSELERLTYPRNEREGFKPWSSRIEGLGGGVECLDYDMNGITFQTDFNVPKFLVYNDNHHEEWQASMDGRPIDILRADVSLKGIYVPPGKHTVVMRYGAWWRYLINGLAFIVFNLIFLGMLWAVGLYLRRKRPVV